MIGIITLRQKWGSTKVETFFTEDVGHHVAPHQASNHGSLHQNYKGKRGKDSWKKREVGKSDMKLERFKLESSG